MAEKTLITSLTNPRVKDVVKLRQRSHRDEAGQMLIEGYREINRSLDNHHKPNALFFCTELFQGENNETLIKRCVDAGAEILEVTRPVFDKMAYRERPDGLLAVAAQVKGSLSNLKLPAKPLILVAEAIEKPGNLGTMLRSADAAGVSAVIVCDKCTDINNPNVVRASIGTLFSLPVIETSSAEAIKWLKAHGIQILAATPHSEQMYSQVDLKKPTAIVMGTEQYGLSSQWMEQADAKVRIPMLGQSDSLNVASATTILLYEAVRQRGP